MCYLVREHQAGAAKGIGATPPPSPGPLRPRWVGAAAVALVGGLAMAALVAPSNAPVLSTRDAAPLAPVVSRPAPVPAAGVVEQTAGLVDDGVPSASDVAKAGLGNCHHGL